MNKLLHGNGNKKLQQLQLQLRNKIMTAATAVSYQIMRILPLLLLLL
jgi:hypothetical protein